MKPMRLNLIMCITLLMMVNHCKPIIRKNEVPACCVLNGLKCKPLPKELENMDPLSCQKKIKTLNEIGIDSNHLPNPELYIIINGQPTKSNNVWRSLVD
uniref:Uncharacterized protein n=1 Tax=Amphimedon queenslandica TaxID=400682 RepID=A0A1X7UML0_AMPQE